MCMQEGSHESYSMHGRGQTKYEGSSAKWLYVRDVSSALALAAAMCFALWSASTCLTACIGL